jgi:predicted ester cyclase
MGVTEDSKALMWRITDEIWNNGRFDHVDVPGLVGSGRARYRASIETLRAAFLDYRNPLDFVIADGAFAVSYGRSTGTHRDEFFGVPPTGRPIDVPTFGILRFHNGQAVERWGFADNLAIVQQLGLMA